MTSWDGHVYKYLHGRLLPFKSPLLEPCPWVSLVQLQEGGAMNGHAGAAEEGGQEEEGEEEEAVVLGLSTRGRLYFGEQMVCNGATGLAVSPWHRVVAFVTAGTRPELHFLSYRSDTAIRSITLF